MAEVTSGGIVPTGLAGYIDQLTEAFRTALGGDMSTEVQTTQMQIVNALAPAYTAAEAALLHVSAGMNIYTATGRQLDDAAAMFGFQRIQGARTTVTATIGGAVGATVPAGSLARTIAGADFALNTSVRIPAGGTITGQFVSLTIGPVPCPAGALNKPQSVVPGWDTVTNAAAGVVGRLAESDAEMKARWTRTTLINERDTKGAIAARIAAVPGVTHVRVTDNPSATAKSIEGLSHPPWSVMIVIRGGTNEDIVPAIQASLVPSTTMGGNRTVVVGTELVRWWAVTDVPIAITVALTVDGATSPGNIEDRVRASLLADLAAYQPGQALDIPSLYGGIYASPGVKATITAEDADGTNLTVPFGGQLLTLADSNITVNITVA